MGCSSSIHTAPASAAAQAAQQGITKPQPVTPDSRVLRGQAYYAAGKVAEALKEFNAIIATWPTYARAYLERGNVRLDQRDYTLAIGDYTLALQLQGNLLQAYMMRCHAQMALRQYAEAMQDAREAERLDPENAQVKALKAQVRKAQVNVVGAGGGAGGAPGSVAGGGGDEEDAFAGLDTPKSTPSPSVRKLCMVCMDLERECRLRPCMHAALCVACAEGLMARGYGCPICSSKIDQVERGSFMRTFTVEEAQGIVASARVVAPLASPGKSPLGRRFQPGTVPVGSSLDNIVEGDEEGHTSADAAIEAAAAALAAAAVTAGEEVQVERLERRRISSGSAASSSGRPTTPPVVLDPHPLAGRTTSSARAVRRGSGSIGGNLSAVEGSGQDANEAGPPPPLPGEVVSYGEREESTASWRQSVGGGGEAVTLAASVLDSEALQRGRSGISRTSSGVSDGGEGASGGDGGDAATVTTVASSSRMDTMGQVADYNIDSAVYDVDGVADATPTALTAVASTFLANSLADWIEEHGGDSPSRSTAAGSPHAARSALPPVDEVADGTAVEETKEAVEGRHSQFSGFASATAAAEATAAADIESSSRQSTPLEIEPETTEPRQGSPRSRACSEAAAGGRTFVTEATAPAAGPVMESSCSRPASAATVAASLEARVSYHGPPPQHRRPQVSHEHPQRPHPWSARLLAAQGVAEAAGGGAAAAATAASSHRALGGAYASCGAAAAAARPFTRQHTAGRGRCGRVVAVALAPSLTAALSPQQPRQRSSRRGVELSAGGGRGIGGGIDLHVRAGPRSQGSGNIGSGSGVMALMDVVLLPGVVP
ncbi:hypothetical protein Vretimale_2401 [Volvox reticuliferus]|uniref:Uncharacterized protein n=1 Tax=Volvox reticuliferus TaxID=1737510 RepID=A0A8J4D6R5_9CHLO|nr:hypothetical protein Vretifemale_4692 [Volvox reticuliferus]GIL96615.1 hypothetical protein Vretimale_2401 [Volvox reticuliferus]